MTPPLRETEIVGDTVEIAGENGVHDRLSPSFDKVMLQPDKAPAASTSEDISAAGDSSGDSVYGRAFWCSYLSNTALTLAVSMLFRYADFVAILGGEEFVLGCIIGIGVSGAVLMRIFQGMAIDRYGARAVWIASMVFLVVSLVAHLAITQLDGWVYVARIAYATSLAGAAGASITFVSLRSPRGRTAEMIGALGSSGFIGMAVGPAIADLMFRDAEISRWQVDAMFRCAAAIAVVSLIAAVAAVSGDGKPVTTNRRKPPVWWLVRRYYPGRILMVSVALGMVIGIPYTFVRTYAKEQAITGIGLFFLVYSVVAFSMRVFARTLPDRWGARRTIVFGSVFLCLGMLAFLVTTNAWTMMLPAVLTGVGHAFVFPAAITGGSLAFPARYRGLATAVMLAMFDLGNLIGQPIVGGLLATSRRLGWAAYPTMFIVVTGMMATAAAFYAWEPDAHERRRGICG
jgi:MFS family permease